MANSLCYKEMKYGWRRGLTAVCLFLVGSTLLLSSGCRKKSPEERWQEVVDMFQQGNVIGGVLKCKSLITELPNDPVAYEARKQLADYYLKTGDPSRSHELLEQIYKGLGVMDERGMSALMKDAQIYLREENFKGGIEKFDWALTKIPHDSPSSPGLVITRADFMLKSDQSEVGMKICREIMLNPSMGYNRHAAREVLARHFLNHEKWAEAIQVYDDYITANPDEPVRSHLEIMKAICMRKMGGRDEEARWLFNFGMDDLMNEAEGILDKETACMRWGDIIQYFLLAEMPEAALDIYRKIQNDYPKTQGAFRAAVDEGGLLADLGRFDEAIQHLKRVQVENPAPQVVNGIQQMIQQMQAYQRRIEAATTSTLARSDAATSPVSPDSRRFPKSK